MNENLKKKRKDRQKAKVKGYNKQRQWRKSLRIDTTFISDVPEHFAMTTLKRH